jgi:hypothetical protein
MLKAEKWREIEELIQIKKMKKKFDLINNSKKRFTGYSNIQILKKAIRHEK